MMNARNDKSDRQPFGVHIVMATRFLSSALTTGLRAALAAAVGLSGLGIAGPGLAQANPPAPPTPAVKPATPPPAARAPRYASREEGERRAKLSRALTPLLDAQPAETDSALLKSVLALKGGAQAAAAGAAETALKDPTARRLMTWLRLLNQAGPIADYRRFLAENPNWPHEDRLRRRFESALLRGQPEAATVLSDFADRGPVSGAGWMALAVAKKARGQTDAARELAKRTWCEERFSSDDEAIVLAALGELLTPRDHKCRLDRLLISNPRLKFIRVSRAQAARRLIPRLAGDEQAKAKARVEVFEGNRGSKALIAVVRQPKLVKGDWGLAYQRAQRARKRRDYEHAYKILKAVPGEIKDHVNRDEWWEERERHARHWLAKGQPARAYELAAGVRPREANPAKAQAFFAGWLALMHLKQADKARGHFERMVEAADGPLSKSKAEFWLARAYGALGETARATEHYAKSAAIRDTFHGLLSQRRIAPNARAIDLPPFKIADEATARRFTANGVVRAYLLGATHGLERRHVLAFYRALGTTLKSGEELALMGQLASHIGDGQGEVRIGKYAVARGFNLYEFAYPVHHLPEYQALREPVEPAMLLAIARQESEFNSRIVSRAGARGVLQVMKITARHVCRQYRIRCRIEDLLNDPAYNARIASAYIADRRDEFAGSYILTLTGFNAGPGRTRQWLRQMGDPRRKNVAPLDWIYRIPFEETRLYVRKVLSNVQIYRARLGERDPLRIDKDLRRGQR
jgi:soluble lytic murein transglycosylase